jgi:hypothetical protein
MKTWLRQFGSPSTDAKAVTGYAISSSSESLVVSILSAGTFFGALFAAPAAGGLILHSKANLNSRISFVQIFWAGNGYVGDAQ